MNSNEIVKGTNKNAARLVSSRIIVSSVWSEAENFHSCCAAGERKLDVKLRWCALNIHNFFLLFCRHMHAYPFKATYAWLSASHRHTSHQNCRNCQRNDLIIPFHLSQALLSILDLINTFWSWLNFVECHSQDDRARHPIIDWFLIFLHSWLIKHGARSQRWKWVNEHPWRWMG